MISISKPFLAAIGLTISRIWACGPGVTPILIFSAEAVPAKAIDAASAAARMRKDMDRPRFRL